MIMLITYLLGILFFIWMDVTLEHGDKEGFGFVHEVNNKNAGTVVLIMMYWSFTTLSTVGFGDYYPISNHERGMMCFGFLAGVACFSYVNGAFLEILNFVVNIDAPFEEMG